MNAKSDYPIIEALCEFQFAPSQPWDMTVPGIFYTKIKEEFPLKKQQIGIDIRPQKETFESKLEMTQRVQFLRPDESMLVQVGPDLLSINHLTPYSNWDIFNKVILSNLEKYIEIINPKGFKRIGLRYINKLIFEKDNIELSDYFNFFPHIPTDLPQIHGPFNMRVEFPLLDNRDRILLTIANLIPEKLDTLSILLDLDYVLMIGESIKFDQVGSWIENAHSELNSYFKATVTDKCNAILGRILECH